jgi:pseudouridine-5'-phosphate glycosidase
MSAFHLAVRPEVADAQAQRRPVVALESSLISHGLPWPLNLETALAAEAAVRRAGAVPATIAILAGQATVGLSETELGDLARRKDVVKASRRDLAAAIICKQTAATTVAATMALAQLAGIRIFATGGIGGAHRDSHPGDVSADLTELSRIAVAVVCAGAKSILDIPRTLEMLETAGVPVIGYNTDTFPAFYVHSSGEPITSRVDSPVLAAAVMHTHWSLGGAGIVLAQPVASDVALDSNEFAAALNEAERQTVSLGVRGQALTPFLLQKLAEITAGKTLRTNQALVIANARLAAQVACAFVKLDNG